MAMVDTESRDAFIDQITSYIRTKLGESAEPVVEFARQFFDQYALEDLAGRRVADVYGCVYSWWDFIQKRDPDRPKVKVYNPNLEQDGWECSHTIVGVLQRDMPFLVDSVRMEVNRRDIMLHSIKSTRLQVLRDGNGQLRTLTPKPAHPGLANDHDPNEALIYLEINLDTNSANCADLAKTLVQVLGDVELVVDGYLPMLDLCAALEDELRAGVSKQEANLDEACDFLQWMRDGNFTFLGYREYDFCDKSGKRVLCENEERRLGVFKTLKVPAESMPEGNFSAGKQRFYQGPNYLAFGKSWVKSRVHRDAYSDYVIVKRYNAEGEVIGESAFLGLYTSPVYTESPMSIPIIRRKLASILEYSGLEPMSHDGKALRRILDTFPRDELFQSSTHELFDTVMGVLSINERRQVRLFMRRDPFGKFASAIVYVPRDIFSTRIRLQISRVLGDALGAEDWDFTTYFSESVLARCHIVFKLAPDASPDYDIARLEAQIVNITRSWEDQLLETLTERHGEETGSRLFHEYGNAFPAGYREDFDARVAVNDIAFIRELGPDNKVAMSFYQPIGAGPRNMRFKVFNWGGGLTLSDVIPVLEHLGLKVLGESPYRMRCASGEDIWLHDFNLEFGLSTKVDAQASKGLFQDAFGAIWNGVAESDGFNRLVLAARLNWREVAMLRVYARYLKQTKFSSSQSFIAMTLANHVEITRNLVALFRGLFDPRIASGTESDSVRIERLTKKIYDGLETVDNLNEDQVIRRYLNLILATLRTNCFQLDADGEPKDYISVKFAPKKIPGLPKPAPEYEIFVYSPRVEGVHLRGGKVARGGLRWSDRLEDYRTEVLGLVKAQNVKNAVIVPSGAKGGFVMRRPPQDDSREAFMAEGIACYKTFIRGLLDVTDNLVSGELVAPDRVIRRDGDDPYLVVAADKGTATFSDIANEIAGEYGFWLGDAFASGGSNGYDHKKMGITARGAWVSVQRHFRELGTDIQSEHFSVIGIGDMAGDVFGNGMLLSEHICLVGAFNHMHIFVDPTPDAASSFAERQRLFALPRSSWADYDQSLISAGGGIFERRAKSIRISPEMKNAFGIEENQLTPNELISAMLKSEVDLIWNGGIGTYVKARGESNASVGDKANDVLRVNGADLRCKVFGEGGNLGMTQRGRIEFSLVGGRCNTDFIDNSAGVDCSDHEVNIKILLNQLVSDGDLTNKQRNILLEEMTEDVAELVLKNNYLQTQALSVAEFMLGNRIDEYRRLMIALENEGRLDRSLEFLPDNEQIMERVARGQSLTRPELAVLIAYVKVKLKDELARSQVISQPSFVSAVETAFPKVMRQRYSEQLYSHRLQREIVSTQVANDMVNNMGITFYHRINEATGADINTIASAYMTARDVYGVARFREGVHALDHQVPSELQTELLNTMISRVRRATRWFIRNRRGDIDPAVEVEFFQSALRRVINALPDVLIGEPQRDWEDRYQALVAAQVPSEMAMLAAAPPYLYSALSIAESSRDSGWEVEDVARAHFLTADLLQLHWFGSQITDITTENFWHSQAKETCMDDLDNQMRTLSCNLMRLAGDADMELEAAIQAWADQQQLLINRWSAILAELKSVTGGDFAMFTVALRELQYLVNATSDMESLQVPVEE
ncbi:NAD-glutamate dehydrogenase [Biformimicrobium ophioploci]|uniref:NAD-glutamate dehydrogenase GdhB n=1 Tax=Biformimicrobium ophioploci TaxID=3036711 RepID=A0ABQ6M209_9GAMM|nr:NAD-glutamate dehydrogenase [Microbulbifer sp. NKW57]GMG88312.1 NAD-glutamate dehydrogenase GdhB [Microbulbifer sp. NKW57]